jgi:glycosyltransferase involved in cell wall biosynthesis
MTVSVGLVVPAFRPDVERLAAYVEALHETLGLDADRIELDDPDEEVAAALGGLRAEVNAVPYRRGKGAAVTAGFEALDTDVVAFADADGSTPPAAMGGVIEPIVAGRADVSVGSRRHPDAIVASHQTWGRRHLGDAFAWLARRLLEVDLYDYQCGAKALTAPAWGSIRDHLYEPGFAWDVELVAIAGALDSRVEEVPIEWHDAPGSTVSPVRTSLRLGRALLTARHRAKRIRNSRLHEAIAAQREEPTALVDQE